MSALIARCMLSSPTTVRGIAFALAVAIVVAAATSLAAPASAKEGYPGLMLMGGDLGDYVAEIAMLDLPGPGATEITGPPSPPEFGYEIYTSGYAFAFLNQVAWGGPAFRYYPGSGLLTERSTFGTAGDAASYRWYRLPPPVAASLDGAVANAISRLRAGDLDSNPVAANFRAAGWTDPARSYYTLRPSRSLSFIPPEANLRGDDAYDFASELIEVLGRPPAGLTEAEPAGPVVWLFHLGLDSGRTFSFTSIGAYAAPADDRPGRVWRTTQSYRRLSLGLLLYYETTPAFDELVATAVSVARAGPTADFERQFARFAAAAENVPPLAQQPGPATPPATSAGMRPALSIALASALGVALLSTVAYRRRAKRPAPP